MSDSKGDAESTNDICFNAAIEKDPANLITNDTHVA